MRLMRILIIFPYAIDIPAGATTLTLPKDDMINVLAVMAANEKPGVCPVQPLVDSPGR